MKFRQFNFRIIARLIGVLLMIIAASMAVPMAVSIVCHDGGLQGMAISAAIVLAVGLLLRFLGGRGDDYELHEKESFWITSLVWMVIPLAGSLPFMFSGVLPRFVDALFESVSGFTTTGSSVIAVPQDIPKSLLVWRSITQWFGGLGLILFVVALMRRLNVGSLQLYGAEFSGTLQRKLHPRMSLNVIRMWTVYILLTVAAVVLLWVTGCSPVDSFCLGISSVSTGGFMTNTQGMTGYSNASLLVVTCFMFVSGINLALIYHFITGGTLVRLVRRLLGRIRNRDNYKVYADPSGAVDEEFVTYLVLFAVAAGCCVLAFVVEGNGLGQSLCYSLFHVASTFSTCGFFVQSPQNGSIWVSVVTFALILIGASSGSTGGGLKLKRLMVLFKYLRNYIIRVVHPNAVFVVKVNRQVVESDYINKIFAFVFLYICFIIGGAFLLTIGGSDIPHSVCMAAANIGNLGPSPLVNGLDANMDYLLLPDGSKATLMVLMLAGRLELFALVAIFSPAYWKR